MIILNCFTELLLLFKENYLVQLLVISNTKQTVGTRVEDLYFLINNQ